MLCDTESKNRVRPRAGVKIPPHSRTIWHLKTGESLEVAPGLEPWHLHVCREEGTSPSGSVGSGQEQAGARAGEEGRADISRHGSQVEPETSPDSLSLSCCDLF